MEQPHAGTRVVGTLPKAWEQEETFGETLYEWMERAPWILISGALHFVVFLVVAAIPWSLFEQREEQEITTGIEQAPEPIVEDPPPEIPEEIIDPTEDLEDVPIEDVIETTETDAVSDEPLADAKGDPTLNSNEPFDKLFDSGIVGIGGGPGGMYGNRFGPGGGCKRRRGPSAETVEMGLKWLAAHQDADGRWDADGFMDHDPANDRTDGAGDPNHDVGVTGLALLAFLGDGHSMTRGAYRNHVRRGVKWLLEAQDRESGLFGEEIGHAFLYDHAIATLALCEVCYIDRSMIVGTRAQKAVNYISRARNPYGAWAYDVPPDGQNDTSVTGWMVLALKSAQDAGLRVDREAFTASLQWFDEMTDPATGRVGYREVGSASSRVEGRNDHFPTEKGEALTAVALLCRFFLGQTPEDAPVMKEHAELLLRVLPEWDPEGRGCDMYYWYYGSYAMYQLGGNHWKKWRKALEPAVIGSQRRDGSAAGSWDPVGPWGFSGGRVYSTATMVLCLEAYYRYARILGGR